MNEPHDPDATADIRSSLPTDSLDAGLAAGFGRPMAPRSSLGDLRPMLLQEAEGESAHIVKPQSDAIPPKEETGDRYQLSGEIARGGMGAILRGRDVDLGRDLAIKVLLEKYANRPDVAQRFVEEAQIGGQLQHPGVVPVYDIGRFGDRPFFTMKLVKGQTLAAILSKRDGPAADRPRLLGIALQVTQTLAYAHAKGVIHRDLKPANIMVGAFGEVQVMDWGLAKVLAEGGIADEERASRMHSVPEDVTTIRTARSTGTAGSHGSDTQAGSMLGTPAYMPPEQANGEVALLDRRADVFGLGAILCEILTGKPPYVGRSGEEVRRKAANGDLADATARLDCCEAEAELIALAKQCLSAEAIDRPKDAQEVADRLSAYLNGVQERLQAAERERAVAVVREAEQRKRRKTQLALAATILALAIGGSSFTWWQNEQANRQREVDLSRRLAEEQRAAADNARLARNGEAVAGLLNQCEEALRAGDTAKAEVAVEAAKKRAAEGGAEKEAERMNRLEADLVLLRELDEVDQFRWTVADKKLPEPAKITTRIREALGRFGLDPDAVSVQEANERASISAIGDRIVSAMDRLLRLENATRVRAVLRRLDPDPYRDAVRDAVLAGDQSGLVELAQQKSALEQPPGFTTFLGESESIPVQRRRQLLKAAVSLRAGNLALLMALSEIQTTDEKNGNAERLRWYQAAVSVAPRNYAANNNLGVTLGADGKLDEAISYFKRIIELDPKRVFAHNNLGNALWQNGRLDEAIACYKKAIQLDPNYAAAHNNLGNSMYDKGQAEEAIACYKKAIELDPKLANAHLCLGNAMRVKGQFDEAIACYKKTIELDSMFAVAYVNLGVALHENGQVEEAVAQYKKAIEIDSKNARAHHNLGNSLHAIDQIDEAIAQYKKAIEIDPKRVLTLYNLGLALRDKGKLDDAIACYKKAVEIEPSFAAAHYNLGNALSVKGSFEEAIACYKKAIELDPKHADAHFNLAYTLYVKGQLDEAIISYKNAIELDPKNIFAHANLGAILCDFKHDYDGAIACFEKAIELDPKLAALQFNLGNAFKSKGQIDKAIACYKKAIELDTKLARVRDCLALAERLAWARDKLTAFHKGSYTPASNAERLSLVEWCQFKKLNYTAVGLYAAAFVIDPKLADDLLTGHRYNAACSAALASAGQGEDAAKIDDKERTRLRTQSLIWLRADLALREKQLSTGKPADRLEVSQRMSHWQKDSDLASIRDAEALAKLPADEQKAFNQLWADVAALLKKAEQKPELAPPPRQKE